jgi:hypothetical protein
MDKSNKKLPNISFKKIKHFCLFLLAIPISINSFAQSINFKYTDGTNSNYDLSDIRKITFDADLMYLHLMDGNIYSWNVSTIGNYEFGEDLLDVENLLFDLNYWSLKVYPNPATSLFHLQYELPREDEIRIELFDIQGKVLIDKRLGVQSMGEHLEILDLTNFPDGTYRCRIIGLRKSITKNVVKQ